MKELSHTIELAGTMTFSGKFSLPLLESVEPQAGKQQRKEQFMFIYEAMKQSFRNEFGLYTFRLYVKDSLHTTISKNVTNSDYY